MDLQSSRLQALSECDKVLDRWDSNHDISVIERRRLSHDAFSLLSQVKLGQKAEGTVEDWLSFEFTLHLSFSQDIRVKSKVRFLRLCALFCREVVDKAFVALLLARCIDPTDQDTLTVLQKRRPNPLAILRATKCVEPFQERKTTANKVFQTLKVLTFRVSTLDPARHEPFALSRYHQLTMGQSRSERRRSALTVIIATRGLRSYVCGSPN